RRQRQRAQRPALRGDPAVAVDRAKLTEQRLRLDERGARWRIEERQRRRIGDAPRGEIENESRQIGGEDLGRIGGRERRRLRLVPEPVADAPPRSSRAAPGLVCPCP